MVRSRIFKRKIVLAVILLVSTLNYAQSDNNWVIKGGKLKKESAILKLKPLRLSKKIKIFKNVHFLCTNRKIQLNNFTKPI